MRLCRSSLLCMGSRSVSEPDWISRLSRRAWERDALRSERAVEEEDEAELLSLMAAGEWTFREAEDGDGVLRRKVVSLLIACVRVRPGIVSESLQ